MMDYHDPYEDWQDYQEYLRDCDELGLDPIEFQRPGSALRRETPSNPRNLPCPNCGEPNRLTPEDRACGYQCDRCADIAEGKIIE